MPLLTRKVRDTHSPKTYLKNDLLTFHSLCDCSHSAVPHNPVWWARRLQQYHCLLLRLFNMASPAFADGHWCNSSYQHAFGRVG